MNPISEKLFLPYRTLRGIRFKGQVSTSRMSVAGQEAYRVMLVRTPCLVKNGDVVFGTDGSMMILMDNPSAFTWARNFKIAHVNLVATWTRPIKIIDPVAKVKRDNGYADMGRLYINFDAPAVVVFDTLQDTKYRFVTGQDVQLDDMVNGKIVKRIVNSFGVKLVECI